MNERAGLHIAVGVDMTVAASAGNAAAHSVAVVPEVHGEQGLGLAELVNLVVHELTLLRRGDQLRHSRRTNRHIGEQPCELCTHIDHGIKVFLAADDLHILAGVAAGDAEQQLAGLQTLHCLDDLLISTTAAAEVGCLLKTFNADGRDKILDPQHLVGKGIVDQRTVGEREERAVAVLLAKADQIGLAHQRFAAGIDVNIGPQFLALPDHIVQLFEGEVQLVAILRRPAAGAVEVAGRGGVHQDRPGNVALILVLQLHGSGRADQRAVDCNGFYQLFPLLVIDVGPQALYQLRPVIVRVCQCSTNSFDL